MDLNEKKNTIGVLTLAAFVSLAAAQLGNYLVCRLVDLQSVITTESFFFVFFVSLSLAFLLDFTYRKAPARTASVSSAICLFLALAILQGLCFPKRFMDYGYYYFRYPMLAVAAAVLIPALQLFWKEKAAAAVSLTGLILAALGIGICFVLRFRGNTWVYWLFFALIVFAVPFAAVRKKAHFCFPDFSLRKFFPIKWKTEHGFAVLALVLGLFLSFYLPVSTEVCWDDDTHYTLISALSQGSYSYETGADMMLIKIETNKNLDSASRAQNQAALKEAEASSYSADLFIDTGAFSLRSAGYLAFLPAVWLARILFLGPTASFFLLRISGLAFYVAVLFFAIRQLENGKLLLAALGLMPTALFLASNVSYDGWVTSLFFLGFAAFFGAIQRRDEKLRPEEAALIICPAFLAVLPKAPYSVLLLLFLLMPKEKFLSPSQRKKYAAAVILAAALPYIYTFCTGLLVSDIADTRGNAETAVSGYGQIRFILAHPAEFISMLFAFLKDYLSPKNCGDYMTSFAFLGGGRWNGVGLAAISILALLDCPEKEAVFGKKVRFRLLSVAFCLAMTVILALCFYLVYTPVGASTVEGCQPRYLIPILFPFLMAALNGWFFVPLKEPQQKGLTVGVLLLSTLWMAGTMLQIFGQMTA